MTTPTIFPIKADTVIPFPCWLKTKRWLYYSNWPWAFHPHEAGVEYYSLNSPDNRPGEVPASFATCVRHTPDGMILNGKPIPVSVPNPFSSNPHDHGMVPSEDLGNGAAAWSHPHPTLEQLAGEAARDIHKHNRQWLDDRATLNAETVKGHILRHISPEWEWRERELAASQHHLSDHTSQLVSEVDNRIKLERDLAALRAENERLTKELAQAHAETQEQARLLGAGGSREAALRAEVERLRRENEAADKIIAAESRDLATLRAQVRELEGALVAMDAAANMLLADIRFAYERKILVPPSHGKVVEDAQFIARAAFAARKETHP